MAVFKAVAGHSFTTAKVESLQRPAGGSLDAWRFWGRAADASGRGPYAPGSELDVAAALLCAGRLSRSTIRCTAANMKVLLAVQYPSLLKGRAEQIATAQASTNTAGFPNSIAAVEQRDMQCLAHTWSAYDA